MIFISSSSVVVHCYNYFHDHNLHHHDHHHIDTQETNVYNLDDERDKDIPKIHALRHELFTAVDILLHPLMGRDGEVIDLDTLKDAVNTDDAMDVSYR